MSTENLTSSDDLDSAMAGGGARQLSSTESTRKSCLGDLADNLLHEILLRLPTAKHALICSSVCKNWYRLILNRFFIGRFVSYHMDHDVNYNCNIAIANPLSPLEPLMLCQNPKFQIKRLDLSSLCEGSEWASMLSSCHDLVLCAAMTRDLCVAMTKEERFRYFICNFLTMQNIALPDPHDELEEDEEEDECLINWALIWEPYCARDTQGQGTLSDGCRYRVLRFRGDKASNIFGLPVEMYCSETPHRWDTVYLFPEEVREELCSNLFAYKEKVHWFNGTNIVAHDPFNPLGCYGGKFCDTSKGFCIPHPDTEQWHPDAKQWMTAAAFPFRGLGSCQGRLRFMELGNLYGKELTADADPETVCLRVWDLKDYENKEWSMERRVFLYALASQSESVFELFANMNDLIISMLAPHPFNEDVIYLSFNDIIASCNMRTEELEVLAEFPGGHLMEYNEHETSAKLITIPWWPTTILQHSQQ